MGEWPFARVYQQHHSVYHLECAFHFSAEVTVARRIHDINFHVVIEDSGVLGENGDTAFPLEFVRVHYAFGNDFV